MNVKEALENANKILKSSEIDSYILDSQLILAKVINKDRLFVMVNKNYELSKEAGAEFNKLISLRSEKMPVKYILHETEFMGIKLYIDNGVLIPRPDTEILCETVIECIKKKKFKSICDVCCGSGAIGISIAKYIQDIKVDCMDISDKAYDITAVNIKNMELNDKVGIIKCDLLNHALTNGIKYDVIVSNPPYIKTSEIDTLMKDVRDYEPHLALDGGEDGLYFYRQIIFQSKNVLNKNGLIAFEIGFDQGETVSRLLIENNFSQVKVIKDLEGLDRVVIAYKYF